MKTYYDVVVYLCNRDISDIKQIPQRVLGEVNYILESNLKKYSELFADVEALSLDLELYNL